MLLSTAGTSVVPYGGTVDLADSAPMRNPSYYANNGLPLTAHFATYDEIYRAQPWVHVLVNKVARAQMRLPTAVHERVSDTERRSARDSEFGELMRLPNRKLGAKGLWLWVRSTRELKGEAILYKLRDDKGRVRELHPVNPANVIVRPEMLDGQPTGDMEYAYLAGTRAGAAIIVFKARDILHFKGFNPETTARGLSACEPLRTTLLNEDAMRRASSAMWRNGARPSVALSTARTLSDGAIERLGRQWDGIHRGVDNWQKTAILEEGLSPTLIQISPEDMQYISGRQLNREECCAVYDIPPPAVHILDRATFSNITEQMRSLYRESMSWRIDEDEDVIATQLAPDFGAGDGSLYFEWDMAGALRAAPETKIAANATAIQSGQMTPAEARAEDNRPFIPGSDRLFVNAAIVPMQTDVNDALKPIDLAAMLQKIYLAVDVIITAEEARSILNEAGANLTGTGPVVKSIAQRDMTKLERRLSAAGSVDRIDESALFQDLTIDDDVRAFVRAAVARSANVDTLRQWLGSLATFTIEEIS